jgi:hypothetical protein
MRGMVNVTGVRAALEFEVQAGDASPPFDL